MEPVGGLENIFFFFFFCQKQNLSLLLNSSTGKPNALSDTTEIWEARGRAADTKEKHQRNPRWEAPRSPTCPIPQSCLCSRNPGDAKDYIVGSHRLQGQEKEWGKWVCATAGEQKPRPGLWTFLPILPVWVSAQEAEARLAQPQGPSLGGCREGG